MSQWKMFSMFFLQNFASENDFNFFSRELLALVVVKVAALVLFHAKPTKFVFALRTSHVITSPGVKKHGE